MCNTAEREKHYLSTPQETEAEEGKQRKEMVSVKQTKKEKKKKKIS